MGTTTTTATTMTTTKTQTITTRSKPTGILKTRTGPNSPNSSFHHHLRSLSKKYFGYYSPKTNTTHLASLARDRNILPQQLNDYILNPRDFDHEPYPKTFPRGAVWPPQHFSDILCAVGPYDCDCVTNTPYTKANCTDPYCDHDFEEWKKATETSWTKYFSLQKTEGMGVGVFTKKEFKRGEVLGWYAGQIVRSDDCEADNDYIMDMDIGVLPIEGEEEEEEEEKVVAPEGTEEKKSRHGSLGSNYSDWIAAGKSKPRPGTRNPSLASTTSISTATTTASGGSTQSSSYPEGPSCVLIDASRQGNWTRFINHSCHPYSDFRIRRVGNVRIMTVEASRRIPKGVELTVEYGADYYGKTSRRVCRCGSRRCVGRSRWGELKEEERPKLGGEAR